MANVKWCEIGPKKTLRFDVLSQMLTKKNIENSFEFIEATSDTLKEKIKEAETKFDVIRIHPQFFDLAAKTIPQSFEELARLGTVDTLRSSGATKKWWPESYYREAFFQFLSARVKNMDILQKALVIGGCGSARAVTAALIRLGFSHINVTTENSEDAKSLVNDFRKNFFNTEFEITPKEELTLLPGVHGVVVNTLSFENSDDFLNDLYYFNFLRKGGWAADLTDVPLESPFIHVAKEIGAQIVMGYEINSFFDKIWCEKVFPGTELDMAEYLSLVKIELEKAPFDQDRYKKVLEDFQI